MTGRNTSYTDTCRYCGKRSYRSRRDAKRAGKQLNNGSMRAYRCRSNPAKPYHIGHLPDAVRNGQVRAEQIFARQDRCVHCAHWWDKQSCCFCGGAK